MSKFGTYFIQKIQNIAQCDFAIFVSHLPCQHWVVSHFSLDLIRANSTSSQNKEWKYKCLLLKLLCFINPLTILSVFFYFLLLLFIMIICSSGIFLWFVKKKTLNFLGLILKSVSWDVQCISFRFLQGSASMSH